MPDVATAPAPAVKPVKEVPPDVKVLVYSKYPTYTINNVTKRVVRRHERDGAGKLVELQIIEQDPIQFENHRAWIRMSDMNDKEDPTERNGIRRGVRSIDGYGRDFVEAVTTPGIPKGGKSLADMFKTDGKRFEAFIGLMNQHGHMVRSRDISMVKILGEIEDVKAGKLKG